MRTIVFLLTALVVGMTSGCSVLPHHKPPYVEKELNEPVGSQRPNPGVKKVMILDFDTAGIVLNQFRDFDIGKAVTGATKTALVNASAEVVDRSILSEAMRQEIARAINEKHQYKGQQPADFVLRGRLDSVTCKEINGQISIYSLPELDLVRQIGLNFSLSPLLASTYICDRESFSQRILQAAFENKQAEFQEVFAVKGYVWERQDQVKGKHALFHVRLPNKVDPEQLAGYKVKFFRLTEKEVPAPGRPGESVIEQVPRYVGEGKILCHPDSNQDRIWVKVDRFLADQIQRYDTVTIDYDHSPCPKVLEWLGMCRCK